MIDNILKEIRDIKLNQIKFMEERKNIKEKEDKINDQIKDKKAKRYNNKRNYKTNRDKNTNKKWK